MRKKFGAAQTQFGDPNIGPFNVGYFGNGFWQNYTRDYPTNYYNVWGRLAGGAGPFSGTTLSVVTNGVGTSIQSSNVLGTFSDPSAAGWQAWHWIPLLDGTGNKAVVHLGGKATLKVTSGNNINTEFFMLTPTVPPVTLTAAVTAGQIHISIPTVTNFNYTVWSSGSVSAPAASWTQVGSVMGSG